MEASVAYNWQVTLSKATSQLTALRKDACWVEIIEQRQRMFAIHA
jgi:hypothetical protein